MLGYCLHQYTEIMSRSHAAAAVASMYKVAHDQLKTHRANTHALINILFFKKHLFHFNLILKVSIVTAADDKFCDINKTKIFSINL